MKTIKLTCLIVVAISLIHFVTKGNDFHIARVLPFCDSEPVGLYHWAGLIMIVIFVWGLRRLTRNKEDDED